jgi:hypothetical protein
MVLMAWTQFFLTTFSIRIIFIIGGDLQKAFIDKMAEEGIWCVNAAIRSCNKTATIELCGVGREFPRRMLHQRTDRAFAAASNCKTQLVCKKLHGVIQRAAAGSTRHAECVTLNPWFDHVGGLPAMT